MCTQLTGPESTGTVCAALGWDLRLDFYRIAILIINVSKIVILDL